MGRCPNTTRFSWSKHFCFAKTVYDRHLRQSYFMMRKGSGNEWVSRMESAVGIHFRRGKQQVSRLLSRWNLSVYSSVWTSRNPDFDLGVDFVDILIYFNIKYIFVQHIWYTEKCLNKFYQYNIDVFKQKSDILNIIW